MAAGRPTFRTRLRTPEPAPPWTLTSAVLAIAAGLVAVIVASVAVGVWLGERPASTLIAWSFGGLVLLAYILQTRRAPAEREALRTGPTRIALFLLLVLGVGLAMLLDIIGLAVTGQFLPLPELLSLAQSPDTLTWLFAGLFMLAVQPVSEELLFRGVALPSLRAALGPWPGIIVCALVYGAFHYLLYPPVYPAVYPQATETTAVWYGFILPAIDGLLLSIVRAGTGSTRAAIILHAGFGLFALSKLLLLAAT